MNKVHGCNLYAVSPMSTKWAVFLGCNTAKRLSGEMGITTRQARARLAAAMRGGHIKRAGKGVFAVKS